jgi:hypothetical protein
MGFEMPEFAKILITALSSFAVGIISEPIRSAMMTFFQAKKLRRALYIELAALHSDLALRRDGEHTPPHQPHMAEFLRTFSFDIYKHARSKPDVFYSLPDAVAFDEIYRMYRICMSQNVKDDLALHMSKRLLEGLDRDLKDGTFNDDLFREVYPRSGYQRYLEAKKTD